MINISLFAKPTIVSRFTFVLYSSRHYSIALESEAQVRVRFAPSPTGHIHLGGLRTALYNYIFAKQRNGKFILRIEDTDQTRVVPGSVEEIEYVLKWSGLNPDESPSLGGNFGPYLQSERLKIYKSYAQKLLDTGKAYRCFCSPARLDLLRKYQSRNREKTRYDGKCKSLQPEEVNEKMSSQENHVVRFALAPGVTTFDDTVFGKISNNLVEALESDPIILKSDGFPTYHFANVIDDQTMKITHVLRGSEWISSTSKHIQIYHALGWCEPKFVHFPLITMKDGSKMSKRNDDSRISSYIDAGYQPTTLFNFLTNSGGGVPKSKQDSNELWSIDELIKNFNFEEMTCHPGSIDLNRLRIYSAKELQQSWRNDPNVVMDSFYKLLQVRGIKADIDEVQARVVIGELINRLVTLNDLLSQDYTFIWKKPDLNWDKRECKNRGIDLENILHDIINYISSSDIMDKEDFLTSMKNISLKYNVEYGLFMKLLRKILTNCDKGLPIHEICKCLGQSRLRVYLQNGLKYISTVSD